MGLSWYLEDGIIEDADFRLEMHLLTIVLVREASEMDRKLNEVYRNHFIQRHLDIKVVTALKTNRSTATRDMDLYRLCSWNED
jgi:hypothetical protein